jgi:hypothetical protein
MAAAHAALSEQDVLAKGGWHPRYARVLALASDGDYGLVAAAGGGRDSRGHAPALTVIRTGNWRGY